MKICNVRDFRDIREFISREFNITEMQSLLLLFNYHLIC